MGDSLILEFEKPSGPVTNPGPDDWNEIAAIDGGHDFEYKRFSAHPNSNGLQITIDGITKELRDTTNYFTSDFRFRFRLKANNDAPQISPPVDDADQWYIDNLMFGVPFVPEYELRWVRVANPYSEVPLSQAVFPIFLNFGIIDLGSSFNLPLEVDIIDPVGDTVYSQFIDIPSYYGVDTTIQFPDWDASGEPGNDTGAYTVIAQIDQVNFQNFNTTETYSKFYLNAEGDDSAIQEYALDDAGMNPGPGVGNDIPKLTGIAGSGIGFDNSTGSIAAGFQLEHYDSVAGARVYFGSANTSPDPINIELLTGGPDGNMNVEGTILARRDTAHLDQFASYYFPHPIKLPGGTTFWIAVNQFMENNMELGGNFARGGATIAGGDNIFHPLYPVYASAYGTQWGSNPADNNGDVSSLFALESKGTDDFWEPLIPDYGWWPAMTSTDQLQPMLHIGDTLPWVGAGTYIPMIRAILSAAPPQSGVGTTSAIPTLTLEPAYPNPFDPIVNSTIITYSLPEHGRVTLTICNVLGDVVKTLVNTPLSAGPHSILWDGRDESGAIVPAGTYFAILLSSEQRATEKIIVIP